MASRPSMFDAVKKTFFDGELIVEKVRKANRKALSRAGAIVRRNARESIRKRKAASKPGTPPSSHIGTLKRGIAYGVNSSFDDVVIGPVFVPNTQRGIHLVPPVLEYGGTVRSKNRRRKRLVLGGTGPIEANAKDARKRDAKGRLLKQNPEQKLRYMTIVDWRGKKRRVVFIRLFTKAQLERAQKIQEELFGSEYISGTIEARPYMNPALQKARPNIPKCWRNQVK